MRNAELWLGPVCCCAVETCTHVGEMVWWLGTGIVFSRNDRLMSKTPGHDKQWPICAVIEHGVLAPRPSHSH